MKRVHQELDLEKMRNIEITEKLNSLKIESELRIITLEKELEEKRFIV